MITQSRNKPPRQYLVNLRFNMLHSNRATLYLSNQQSGAYSGIKDFFFPGGGAEPELPPPLYMPLSII